jgi:hypothetical protein
LNEVHPKKKILLGKQGEIYKRLLLLTNPVEDDIFEFNWQSKFLYSLSKNNSKKSNISIFNHAELLKKHLLTLIIHFNETYETNYLAVGLESLCSLLSLIQDKQPVLDNITHLYYLLQQRYHNGLFYFIKGVARLDITGHTLNGLDCL